jgi:hypothetical protein
MKPNLPQNLPPIWFQPVSPVFRYVLSRLWRLFGPRTQKRIRDFIGLSFLGTYWPYYVALLIAMIIFALRLRIPT